MNKPASTDPAPADKPTAADPTSFETATADSTIFVPIAASAGSKKARAKKVATKEPINYMLLIRVTCGDKKIVKESSMESLQELESTFDYGKELQKQSAVVAVKLREIKAPQSTRPIQGYPDKLLTLTRASNPNPHQ